MVIPTYLMKIPWHSYIVGQITSTMNSEMSPANYGKNTTSWVIPAGLLYSPPSHIQKPSAPWGLITQAFLNTQSKNQTMNPSYIAGSVICLTSTMSTAMMKILQLLIHMTAIPLDMILTKVSWPSTQDNIAIRLLFRISTRRGVLGWSPLLEGKDNGVLEFADQVSIP